PTTANERYQHGPSRAPSHRPTGAPRDQPKPRHASSGWGETPVELDQTLSSIAGQRERDGPAPELGWAWRRLTACHGRVEVGTLAQEVGWSRRHLGERFRREFGLTPKVAGRVMRFEVAHRMLRAPVRPGLAEVSARCGFADQAHLTREWRELAGCTPSNWLAEELPSVQDTGTPMDPSWTA
ncbi:MAG: helix-turn-helix domain-containing protein, partial [Pseudonocardiaceae bacterium]